MKKILAVLAILALVSGGLAGCAAKPTPTPTIPAEVPGAINWRWQHNYPANHTLYFFAQNFADDLKTATGGRLVLQLMPQGTAVANTDILDAVAKGTIEMGTVYDPAVWGEKDPILYLVGNIPGGPIFQEMEAWYYADQLGGRKFATDAFTKLGVHWEHWEYGAAGLEYVSNKSLKSTADYKGAKIAATGWVAKVLKEPEFGAVVSDVKEADLASALSKATVDAVFYGMPTEVTALNLQKSAKYVGFPAITRPCRLGGLIVNNAQWDGLGQELQMIFRQLCQFYIYKFWSYETRDNAKIYQDLKAAGLTMVMQDQACQNALCDVSIRLADKVAETNADFKKMWDAEKAAIGLIRVYLKMQVVPYYEGGVVWDKFGAVK